MWKFSFIVSLFLFVSCGETAYELNTKGEEKFALSDYSEAEIAFSKAILLKPDFALAYYNKGVLNFHYGRYERAIIEDFNIAIKINPNYTEAFIERGKCKFELNDFKGSISDFSKAIILDSTNVDAYYNRGGSKYELGDLKGAIEDYNMAIENLPSDGLEDLQNQKVESYEVFSMRGVAKSEMKDYKGAIDDYNKAINLEEDNASLIVFRGIARKEQQDYKGAIFDFDKAISIDSNNSGAYYSRGVAKFLLKDNNGACLDWEKSVSLGFSDASEEIGKFCN